MVLDGLSRWRHLIVADIVQRGKDSFCILQYTLHAVDVCARNESNFAQS